MYACAVYTKDVVIMKDVDSKPSTARLLVQAGQAVPEKAARPSQDQLLADAVFDAISEGVFIADREGFIEKANPAFLTLTQYKSEQIIGQHCSRLWEEHLSSGIFKNMRKGVDAESSWRMDTTVVCNHGRVRPATLSVTAIRDLAGQVTHYIGILLDTAERRQSEQRIYRLAYYDSLTEIPNRVSFFERLDQALASAGSTGTSLAVLFLDLDRFKPINDSLGHGAGDQLLKAVARRLLYCIRENDLVARVGGDEFAILLTRLNTPEEAESTAIITASRILAQFATAFMIEGRDVFSSTSIGIALFPRDGQLPDELVRNADMAMYAAKKAGKNAWHFYDHSMNEKAMERLVMENAMRKALNNSEFELYFQPQCEADSGALAGLEVLLRWQHPQFGIQTPAEFLALAEETDLINPIGEWVFEKALGTLEDWLSQGFDPGYLAINISSTQFKRTNFADYLQILLRRHEMDPSYIQLEITEHAIMEDVARSQKILDTLSDAGIRIAIDDFGVGYSSLNHLRRFPVHTLKIDRDFVRDLELEGGTQALTNAVIAIGKSLNLSVIAEGVETAGQLEYLRTHGCRRVQGHYLSAPMNAAAVMEKYFCNVLDAREVQEKSAEPQATANATQAPVVSEFQPEPEQA
ncbi:Hypothetical protein HDN1F_12400 [gamma proteobacterium HdN1]|nr:Hypothetical protein HDN1F_12400 [gamma proteobacterium HdN1]